MGANRCRTKLVTFVKVDFQALFLVIVYLVCAAAAHDKVTDYTISPPIPTGLSWYTYRPCCGSGWIGLSMPGPRVGKSVVCKSGQTCASLQAMFASPPFSSMSFAAGFLLLRRVMFDRSDLAAPTSDSLDLSTTEAPFWKGGGGVRSTLPLYLLSNLIKVIVHYSIMMMVQ
jgi:hypothetical protein